MKIHTNIIEASIVIFYISNLKLKVVNRANFSVTTRNVFSRPGAVTGTTTAVTEATRRSALPTLPAPPAGTTSGSAPPGTSVSPGPSSATERTTARTTVTSSAAVSLEREEFSLLKCPVRISHHRGVSATADHDRPELHLRHQLHSHGSPHPPGGLETQLGPRPGQVPADQQPAGGEPIIRGAELPLRQPAGPGRLLLRGDQQSRLLLRRVGRVRPAGAGRHPGGEAGPGSLQGGIFQHGGHQARPVHTVLLLGSGGSLHRL